MLSELVAYLAAQRFDMAGGELVVELSVEPKLAEVGGRVCIKWTGGAVEHDYIGLFPTGTSVWCNCVPQAVITNHFYC